MESEFSLVFINNGILSVDGVVSLAIEESVKIAALRIFVDIPDELRKQRLIKFYSDIKILDRKEYESIIETGEADIILMV